MEKKTRAVVELFDVPGFRPAVYVWRGQTLQGHEWVPMDPPVGGDSVAYDMFGMRAAADLHGKPDPADARYVEIPQTAWGDYVGASWTRSNARSIRRDYPDDVVTVAGDHSFETLVVPADAVIPARLFEAIVARVDSAFYDESDWSQLEYDLEQEQWEDSGRDQFRDEIRDLARHDDEDDDVPELDDAFVDELFRDQWRNGAVEFVCETATGGVWHGFDRAAACAWTAVRLHRVAEWTSWARDLSAPVPGQLAFAI